MQHFLRERSGAASFWFLQPELRPWTQTTHPFQTLNAASPVVSGLAALLHTHSSCRQIHWPVATRSIHTIPFCCGCTRARAHVCMCWRPLIPLQCMLTLFLASLSLSIPCPLSLVNYTETAGLNSLIWKDTTPRRADPVTLLLTPKSSTHRLVDKQKLHTEDADTKKNQYAFLFALINIFNCLKWDTQAVQMCFSTLSLAMHQRRVFSRK